MIRLGVILAKAHQRMRFFYNKLGGLNMDNYKHYSVLLNESIDMLNINPNGIYVDCTLGGGGHSSVILSKLINGHLYSFDQDDYAIKKGEARLSEISSNYTIIKSNFLNIKSESYQEYLNNFDILYEGNDSFDKVINILEKEINN